MATIRIVKPNNTQEQSQKVLKDIAGVIEKILSEEYGNIKVELNYSSNSRQAV